MIRTTNRGDERYVARIVAVATLAIVVSCARPRPTANGQPDAKGNLRMVNGLSGTSEPPADAAIVVHDDQGSSIAILDLRSHRLREIGPERHRGSGPVWSPNGSYLVYRDKNRLIAYGGEPSRAFEFLDDLAAGAKYAVSPDSREIAVGIPCAILFVPAVLPPDRTKVRRVAIPSGCRILDLLWAKDSSAVFILFQTGSDPQQSHLLRVGVSGRTETIPSHSALRLLGWRNSRDILVISRPKEDGQEPGFLSLTGAFQPFRPHAAEPSEGGATVMVIGYLPAADEVLVAPQGEDGGDPLKMHCVSPRGEPDRPWLAEFPRLTDLVISRDGLWAMFVDPTRYLSEGPKGGDIYLTATDSDDAKLVLEGIPGDVAYLTPTPRPGSSPSRVP